MELKLILSVILDTLLLAFVTHYCWEKWREWRFDSKLWKERERVKSLVLELDENDDAELERAKNLINQSGVFHWQSERSAQDMIKQWKTEEERNVT